MVSLDTETTEDVRGVLVMVYIPIQKLGGRNREITKSQICCSSIPSSILFIITVCDKTYSAVM